MGLLRRLIRRLPAPAQQAARHVCGRLPVRLRYGRDFWSTYHFLEESQWWGKERLEAYQMAELRNLLSHAARNVPYYRRTFAAAGIRPEDIQGPGDLNKIPFLTKDLVRQHCRELTDERLDQKQLEINHTSGTAGKPLQFATSLPLYLKELAFIYHHWSRVGVRPGTPLFQIRGAVIAGDTAVEYNPAHKILRFSPLIKDRRTIVYYLETMKKYGAEYLHGYPSIIAVFAGMIEQLGLVVPFRLKAVLFASESVYPWQRSTVQRVFNCRVSSHYGMAEQAVLAGECEKTSRYHCVPQYGITELDPETHEIVGTSLLNTVTPFIRYRTSDVASVPSAAGCDACGRNYYPVFDRVEGRLEDFIVTPEGSLIAPAVLTHPLKDLQTIKGTQLIQRDPARLLVKLLPLEGVDPLRLQAETAALVQGLQTILGAEMMIESQTVEALGAPGGGKFRWVTSEVAREMLETGAGLQR